MQLVEHGGGCCGVTHLWNFPVIPNDYSIKAFNKFVEDFMDEGYEYEDSNGYDRVGRKGHLVEVVLTDDQMVDWASHLKAAGFRLHQRWLNDNSGNYCNLLSLATKRPNRKAPYSW